MKKVIRYLLAVLSTAWTGALTIFSFIVIGTGLFQFADRFLNNNIVSCIVLAVVLICITIGAGSAVKEKMGKGDTNE